jgi:hypothetical protein
MKKLNKIGIIAVALTFFPVAAQADVSISQPSWSLANGVDSSGGSADLTIQSPSSAQGQVKKSTMTAEDFIAWGGTATKRGRKRSR